MLQDGLHCVSRLLTRDSKEFLQWPRNVRENRLSSFVGIHGTGWACKKKWHNEIFFSGIQMHLYYIIIFLHSGWKIPFADWNSNWNVRKWDIYNVIFTHCVSHRLVFQETRFFCTHNSRFMAIENSHKLSFYKQGEIEFWVGRKNGIILCGVSFYPRTIPFLKKFMDACIQEILAHFIVNDTKRITRELSKAKLRC